MSGIFGSPLFFARLEKNKARSNPDVFVLSVIAVLTNTSAFFVGNGIVIATCSLTCGIGFILSLSKRAVDIYRINI